MSVPPKQTEKLKNAFEKYIYSDLECKFSSYVATHLEESRKGLKELHKGLQEFHFLIFNVIVEYSSLKQKS